MCRVAAVGNVAGDAVDAIVLLTLCADVLTLTRPSPWGHRDIRGLGRTMVTEDDARERRVKEE